MNLKYRFSLVRFWQFLVVLAAFTTRIFSYGIAATPGILYMIFLDAFNAGQGTTAWASSLITAANYFATPISSVLLKYVSCRVVVSVGGIVAALGLSVSYFATNVAYLVISYGVVAGCGFGLCVVPCSVVVAQFFDKRRNVALGLGSAGGGLGSFIFPPLMLFLIETYSWRGCLLICGALTTNICVCAALMWKPELIFPPEFDTEVSSTLSDNEDLKDPEEENLTNFKECKQISLRALPLDDTQPSKKFHSSLPKCFMGGTEANAHSVGARKTLFDDIEHAERELNRLAVLSTMAPLVQSENHLHVRRHALESKENLGSSAFLSMEDVFAIKTLQSSHHTLHKRCQEETVSQSCVEPASSECKLSCSVFSTHIFHYKPFLIFCLNNVLFTFGMSIVMVHVGAYATISHGIPQRQTQLLFGLLGGMTLLGKVLLGLLASWRKVGGLIPYTVCFTLTGVVTLFLPLCTSFESLIVACLLIGSFGSALGGALQPAILLEMFDINTLAESYGIVIFCNGIGQLIGAPIAGWLFEYSGSYDTSFFLGGSVIVLSGLIMIYPLAVAYKKRRQDDERNN